MKTDNQVQIRKFRIEDYDAVIALWEVSGLPYKPGGRDSRGKIAKEIAKEIVIFLVAEKDGQVVGSVLGTQDGRKGWINRLAVLPQFRHHGIAQMLVKKVEEEIYKLGIEIVTCLIEEDNPYSMEFFQKSGYIKHTDIFYFSKRKYSGV